MRLVAQDLCTKLRDALALARVFEGLGVGAGGASALAATANWLLRDGVGLVASLAFTSAAASAFALRVKRWRFFADVVIDVGLTLEVAAASLGPSGSRAFVGALCAANVAKVGARAAVVCPSIARCRWCHPSSSRRPDDEPTTVAASLASSRVVRRARGEGGDVRVFFFTASPTRAREARRDHHHRRDTPLKAHGRERTATTMLCGGRARPPEALGGVSAGAANSAIAMHFASGRGEERGARGGGGTGVDISEIASKGGAVGTLSGLLGLTLSLALTHVLRAGGGGAASGGAPWRVVFGALTPLTWWLLTRCSGEAARS